MSGVEVMISGVKVRFPNKPYPSQFSMMSKIIKGLQKQENCLLESPTGSGKTLSLLCSVVAWQQTERANQIKAINEDREIRLQKIREACYCDCKSRKSNQANTNEEASQSEFGIRKKKVEIEYEDSSTDNSGVIECGDDESESSTNEDSSSLEANNKIGDCACLCHGMYRNDVTETIGDLEIKKIKKIPTVYFATRTHKQIANVVKEFKKTSYGKEVRMTILASRAHTCVHPTVSKGPNKDEACKKLIDPNRSESGSCIYYKNFKKNQLVYENYGFKDAWDIEDLVKTFKRKRICSYYASREIMEVVDIIFCPYNYLIDPRIRKSMKINLDDSIVIVDEAHNIEDSCRESTTSLITKLQLELCIESLKDLTNSLALKPDMKEAARFFLEVFENLSCWIDSNTLNMEQRDFDASMSRIFTGTEMCSEFKTKIKLGPERIPEFERQSGILFAEFDKEDPNAVEVPDTIRLLADYLYLAIDFLYMNNHDYMEDFKIAIVRTKIDEIAVGEGEDGQAPPPRMTQFQQKQQNNKFTYVIHFWCLNPAVAFHYLKTCHSVILCSGTLSPMDTFQSELGVKFEHTLEANHVISDKQVWVGCLGSGPTGVNLLSTYKFTEQYSYQDETGRLVLDICKTIPYGVLLFVPSYSLLSKLISRWNETNFSDKIRQYKEIFSETRVAKGFDTMLKEYYECIDNSTGGEFHNGALMLAVYRGRASEGLDFSDNYARAVIAVGIPYPSIKDVQVDLKRKYNNTLCRQKNLLNGDEWYEIQAYRAINQGLGRCIRHRKDWGAIILVDDRYFKNPQKYMKGVSKWIRTKFKTFPSYSKAIESLKEFNENLKDFDRDALAGTQCEQSQVNSGPSSQASQIPMSFSLDFQKENSSTIDPVVNNQPTLKNVNLEKYEFANSKKNFLTESSKSNNTPVRSIVDFLKLKTQDESTPNGLKSSVGKKRKPEIFDSEVNEVDSPDLAAKKEFFNFAKKNKVAKKEIKYDDDSDHEIIETEPTVIDSSLEDRFENFMKNADEQMDVEAVDNKSDRKENKSPNPELYVSIIPSSPVGDNDGQEMFYCIHCNEFIADFQSQEIIKESFEDFSELPDDLRINIDSLGLKRLTIVSSEMDRIAFESNTKIKSFAFFMSSTSLKLNQNSFVDSNNRNCWQFFECLACMKIVGFILKFSNSGEKKFISSALNKIILIKDYSQPIEN